MNIFLIIAYVVSAVSGSTLIKLGGLSVESVYSFTIPWINLRLSVMSLFGILFYGISFFLYIILLNRFDLSFISPLTIGLVYLLLMLTAVVFFNESFTIIKTIGCVLILVGVLIIAATNK